MFRGNRIEFIGLRRVWHTGKREIGDVRLSSGKRASDCLAFESNRLRIFHDIDVLRIMGGSVTHVCVGIVVPAVLRDRSGD